MGSLIHEVRFCPRYDSQGEVIGVIGVSIDITERKRAEEDLRQYHAELEKKVQERTAELSRARDRLESLYTHAIQLSRSDTIEKISELTLDAVSRIMGFSLCGFGIVEDGLLKFIHMLGVQNPEMLEFPLTGPGISVRAVLTGKTQLVKDVRLDKAFIHGPNVLNPSRSELVIPIKLDEYVAAVINVESIVIDAFTKEDVTLFETLAMNVSSALERIMHTKGLERTIKKRTVELYEAQRMATIGETAMMVGNDLRNPLQVIIGNISFLKKKLEKILTNESQEKNVIEKIIKKINDQSEYMNKIVSDLMNYARPIKPQYAKMDLCEMIRNVISSIKVPESIEISMEFDDDFPYLWLDETMLRRVFINLCMNAIQSMCDGGRLKIKGSRMENEVLINVEDTGIGIPQENMDMIFKPLFTTKAKGMGLGLSVCKRIIEAHGGGISVETKVGVGSTFIVRLPLQETIPDQMREQLVSIQDACP